MKPRIFSVSLCICLFIDSFSWSFTLGKALTRVSSLWHDFWDLETLESPVCSGKSVCSVLLVRQVCCMTPRSTAGPVHAALSFYKALKFSEPVSQVQEENLGA